MEITLNQPVDSNDGPFGEVGDIVVDPRANSVTHLIVEPHHRHDQARLVPMSFVEVGEGVLTVRLDEPHLRSLEHISETDYVAIDEPVDLGDQWGLGVEHIVALPFSAPEFDSVLAGGVGMGDAENRVLVDYDRIPRGECEIRRASSVVSSDDQRIGLVSGVVVDDNRIESIIIRTGLVGFRHRVVAAIGVVAEFRNDQITLALDRSAFRRLPRSDSPADKSTAKLASFGHRLADAAKRFASALRSVVGRR